MRVILFQSQCVNALGLPIAALPYTEIVINFVYPFGLFHVDCCSVTTTDGAVLHFILTIVVVRYSNVSRRRLWIIRVTFAIGIKYCVEVEKGIYVTCHRTIKYERIVCILTVTLTSKYIYYIYININIYITNNTPHCSIFKNSSQVVCQEPSLHHQALLLSNRISVIHGSRINWETLCCPPFRTYCYQILCHVGGTSPSTWHKIW